MYVLDRDNTHNQHIMSIVGGDYAGNYVNTNIDRPMWAGKYIFNLTSKGTNPNVIASPSRAYLTVNRASNNLEWDTEAPILLKVGEKVDLGIFYQADIWCTFNTDYDEELIELSSEGATSNNPHWFATGLKEGETTLYFGIECRKNDMGFYDFTDSRILSKRIKVEPSSGIEGVIADKDSISVRVQNGTILILNKAADSIVRVFTLHGVLLKETKEQEISDINRGIHIVMVGESFIQSRDMREDDNTITSDSFLEANHLKKNRFLHFELFCAKKNGYWKIQIMILIYWNIIAKIMVFAK